MSVNHLVIALFCSSTLIQVGTSQNLHVLQEENVQYNLHNFFTTMKQYFYQPVDIVFVLDKSRSVALPNFQQELKLIELIARMFILSPDSARVALVAFHFDFITTTTGDMCNFMYKLEQVGYGEAGWTNTGTGLLMAGDVLRQSTRNSTKIIVLLLEAESNWGEENPVVVAKTLREREIIIFCIGIATIKEDELLEVATSSKHVFVIKDYKYIVLVNELLRNDIVNKVFVKRRINDCNSVCLAGSHCCDGNADCFCGSDGVSSCQCLAGFMGSGHTGKCTQCPGGQYNPEVGQGECLDCPANSNTDYEGATSKNDCRCDPGFNGSPINGIPCKSKNCPKLYPPIGGRLYPDNCGNEVKDECNFICHPPFCPYNGTTANYQKEEANKLQKKRVCLSNGQWSGPEFHCEEASCNPIDDPKHGNYDCNTRSLKIGTLCTLECFEGYKPTMNNKTLRDVTWTCLESGQWDRPFNAICKAFGCRPLKTSATLHVKPLTCGTAAQSFGTKCQYFCSPGYNLIDYSQKVETLARGARLCDANGWKWREEKVRCKVL